MIFGPEHLGHYRLIKSVVHLPRIVPIRSTIGEVGHGQRQDLETGIYKSPLRFARMAQSTGQTYFRYPLIPRRLHEITAREELHLRFPLKTSRRATSRRKRTPKPSIGYRSYDENAIKTLLFLHQAQTLGITLNEIKQLLELTRDGQCPCQAVRELARQHLNDIDARIHQLRVLRNNCAVCCPFVRRPTAMSYAH
jgi:hypothetical protein